MNDNPMTFEEIVNYSITLSMKKQDKVALDFYRNIKSELTKASKNSANNIVDYIPVLKNIKKRLLEEVDIFKSAGRDVSTQETHLKMLEEYLPTPLTEEEVFNELNNYLNSYDRDSMLLKMPVLMSHAKAHFSTRFDGKIVASVINKILAS